MMCYPWTTFTSPTATRNAKTLTLSRRASSLAHRRLEHCARGVRLETSTTPPPPATCLASRRIGRHTTPVHRRHRRCQAVELGILLLGLPCTVSGTEDGASGMSWRRVGAFAVAKKRVAAVGKLPERISRRRGVIGRAGTTGSFSFGDSCRLLHRASACDPTRKSGRAPSPAWLP